MPNYLYIRAKVAVGLICAFLLNTLGPIPTAQAQDFALPAPGIMVHLSPAYNPPILKGLKVHPDNPFKFDFILDKGDSVIASEAKQSQQEQLKTESRRLIKYFLASLTIPEKDLWVNLSPYEKDRIIPNSFGLTEMGRDLLAEDYMLKQITASLIYPEDAVGKKFWKRIYEEASKKFGTTNIPVNTFNKVWIVPEKAVVYENAKAGTAYVVESKLKVMLEQDYLSLSHHVIPTSNTVIPAKAGIQDTSFLGSQIVREIILPELTKEINQNQNFAQLRQVYNSLILATWYKKKIKDSILSQVYSDKNKVTGVSIDDPQEKEKIYQRYLQAFKKGAYNYIKEEHDPLTQQVTPRKYFSGGILWDMAMESYTSKSPDAAQMGRTDLLKVSAGIEEPGNRAMITAHAKAKDFMSSPLFPKENDQILWAGQNPGELKPVDKQLRMELAWLGLTDRQITAGFLPRINTKRDFLNFEIQGDDQDPVYHFQLPEDLTLAEGVKFIKSVQGIPLIDQQRVMSSHAADKFKHLAIVLANSPRKKSVKEYNEMVRTFYAVGMILGEEAAEAQVPEVSYIKAQPTRQDMMDDVRLWLSLEGINKQTSTKELVQKAIGLAVQNIQIDLEFLTYWRGARTFKQSFESLEGSSIDIKKLKQEIETAQKPSTKTKAQLKAVETILKSFRRLKDANYEEQFGNMASSSFTVAYFSRETNCVTQSALMAQYLEELGIEVWKAGTRISEEWSHVFLLARLANGQYIWIDPYTVFSSSVSKAILPLPDGKIPSGGINLKLKGEDFKEVSITPWRQGLVTSFYNNFGLVLREAGAFSLATSFHRKAIELNPKDLHPYHLLAGDLVFQAMTTGDFIGMEDVYRKILQLNPNDEIAQENLKKFPSFKRRVIKMLPQIQEILKNEKKADAAMHVNEKFSSEVEEIMAQSMGWGIIKGPAMTTAVPFNNNDGRHLFEPAARAMEEALNKRGEVANKILSGLNINQPGDGGLIVKLTRFSQLLEIDEPLAGINDSQALFVLERDYGKGWPKPDNDYFRKPYSQFIDLYLQKLRKYPDNIPLEPEKTVRILLDYYYFYHIQLIATRLWEKGADREVLNKLLHQLQSGPDSSGQQFVSDISSLILLNTGALSFFEPEYLSIERSSTQLFKNYLRNSTNTLARHLGSIIFGNQIRKDDEEEQVNGLREVNALDYVLAVMDLVKLLQEYSLVKTRDAHDPEKRAIVESLLNIFSSDPDILMNPQSPFLTTQKIESNWKKWIRVSPSDFADTDLKELGLLMQANMKDLGHDLDQMPWLKPSPDRFSPLGVRIIYSLSFLDYMLMVSLTHPGFENFSLEDHLMNEPFNGQTVDFAQKFKWWTLISKSMDLVDRLNGTYHGFRQDSDYSYETAKIRYDKTIEIFKGWGSAHYQLTQNRAMTSPEIKPTLFNYQPKQIPNYPNFKSTGEIIKQQGIDNVRLNEWLSATDTNQLRGFGLTRGAIAESLRHIQKTFFEGKGFWKRQANLIASDFEKTIALKKGKDQTITIYQIGLGGNPEFKETASVFKALEIAFQKAGIFPEEQKNWHVNYIAVDIMRQIVDLFVEHFKTQAFYQLNFLVAKADTTRQMQMQFLGEKYKADYIFHRNTTYANQNVSRGLYRDFIQGSNRLHNLWLVLDNYISIRNVLSCLANKGTRYVVELATINPDNDVLNIPGASVLKARAYDREPQERSNFDDVDTGIYKVQDPMELSKRGIKYFIEHATHSNRAMTATSDRDGGIDLTPANKILQSTKMDEGITFHVDPAMLQQLQNARGFTVGNVDIQPLKSLPEFLGLS